MTALLVIPTPLSLPLKLEAWSFLDNLPPHWSRSPPSLHLVCAAPRSAMSDTVMGRDLACVLTGCSEYESQHPILYQIHSYFPQISQVIMRALSLKTRPLGFKSPICTCTMRTRISTIPTTFVMGYVFVPISTMGSSILSSFRTHLRYSSRFSYSVDHPELYHRRPMEINTGVSVEFLYARFAYNIIIIRILQADPLIHLATKIKIPISLLHKHATNSRYKSGRRF